MHATVDARALRNALRRLKPRAGRLRSLRESSIGITAGGNALVLLGTLASSGSVPAVVHQGGSARIPLEPAIKLLATYAKGASVVLRSEPGKFWFDRFNFTTAGEL